MKKELLMSFDEYDDTKHAVPYTYILSRGKQYIFYFGSRHSFDPTDTQFAKIESFWNDFLEKTQGQSRIAFLEGGNRPALSAREEAIHQGGEMHFVAYLAHEEGIETFSPEPPSSLLFEELSKHFPREAIAYYYFARVCYQWNRMVMRPDFQGYVNRFLRRDAVDSGWNDFSFTIDHMIEIQKDLFGTDFNKDDKKFFYDVINPTTEFSVVNQVSRFEDAGFRDLYVLEQTEKSWKEGKSIFIIYGCSHAVMHEPVLRDMVEE